MCEKTFKIKTIFFQTIQFFDGILYNILLLFGGLFISGGLRPPPKWPIASTSPAFTLYIIHTVNCVIVIFEMIYGFVSFCIYIHTCMCVYGVYM